MAAEDDSYHNSQPDSQYGSQPDNNQSSQSDGGHPSQTDSSNRSSDKSKEKRDPATEIVPVRHYLSLRDAEHFQWDDEGRETSKDWLKPVREVGLDESKHKVFNHNNKDYLVPSSLPFVSVGFLGRSGSNNVYKVVSPPAQNYKRPLALKVIVCTDKSRTPGPQSKARRLALEEVKNMSRIRHSHIVVYVASFEDYSITVTKTRRIKNGVKTWKLQEDIGTHVLAIAMYPPGECNLLDFMEKKREHRKEMRYMHSFFGCLSQAVAYLHRSEVQIRHKDIKPANIVIDENYIPLLTDFGLSKHFEVGKESDGPTAKTLKYAEPEAVRETSRNERSDIFPLGCVFLEMATVLLGLPPSFAEQRLKNPASRDEFKYCESLDRLPTYLAELREIAQDLMRSEPGRERSARAIVEILPVIAEMMDEEIKGRPFAKQLYPKFRHLYDVYPRDPGPCRSCEEEILTERSYPLTPSPSMLVSMGVGRTMTRSSTGASGGTHLTGSTTSRTGTTASHRTNSSGHSGGGGVGNGNGGSNSNRSSLVVGVKRMNSLLLAQVASGSPTEMTKNGD